MINDLLLLIILLLLSAFFSSSELAFIVANKLKIEVKALKKNIAAQAANFFVKDTQTFFSTILIGNNIVNVAFASLATIFFADHFGWNEYEILLAISLITLFLGELLPKYIAREGAEQIALLFSIPLRFLSLILYPLIKLTTHLSNILTPRKQRSVENLTHLFDKDDLIFLIDEVHKAGNVKKDDTSIINKVFDFSEQKVYEAMRPRTEIVGLEINESIDSAINLFVESGYSKIIVYEENLDNIKGVILAKDMFSSPKDIISVIREIPFYPDTKKSLEVLNELLNKNTSIAVVVDEFGGTAGIVTTEDIIEELFGEIKDEYDTEEIICKRVAKDSYIISGKVEIDYINEKYKLQIPTGEYETIAGFIVERTGKIPKQGEKLLIDDFEILIIRADKVRIDLIKLINKNNA